jgi:XrtJ-associated TM-motif-TM protein
MRMLPRYKLLLAMLFLALVLPASAQTGCEDSPESPTIVLAMVGAIGAIAVGLRGARKGKS